MPSLADTSPPQTAGVPIPDGQIDKAIASLDAIASDVMKRSGIPGMAIAVVRDGKTVYAKGFGVRKIGESQPVDADTVFQIASLSKSLAATVVAHEVGAGIVKWDTPLVAHLPWFKLIDPWVTPSLGETIQDSYGQDHLHLTVVKGYLRKLISNDRVARYLEQYQPELLIEFQKIADMTSTLPSEAA